MWHLTVILVVFGLSARSGLFHMLILLSGLSSTMYYKRPMCVRSWCSSSLSTSRRFSRLLCRTIHLWRCVTSRLLCCITRILAKMYSPRTLGFATRKSEGHITLVASGLITWDLWRILGPHHLIESQTKYDYNCVVHVISVRAWIQKKSWLWYTRGDQVQMWSRAPLESGFLFSVWRVLFFLHFKTKSGSF